jgi:hypothetical protein
MSIPKTMLQTALPEPLRDKSTNLPSAELQQLWFATLSRPWSSLIVVPAHPGMSALFVARALAEVGGLHRSSPIRVISAEGIDMGGASRLIIEMTSTVAQGGLVIVAIDSVVTNPTGIPVSLAADAVLMCVALGDSDFKSARRTVELIGKDRFLGSVTFQATGKASAPPASPSSAP